MDITIGEHTGGDVEGVTVIWNHIVEEGVAFPQTGRLIKKSADAFFSEQSFTGTVFDRHGEAMVGLHIPHPNSMGWCGRIYSASYTVKWDMGGRQIGEELVRHRMEKGREPGFGILQLSTVVKTNEAAFHLY